MSKFNWSNPPYKIKKDGTQSKVHDRSVYRTPGNEVELAYGTFTVLEAEKVDKIWYVTLKGVNETFKIKQQQMGNKKLPKTRVIIEDVQPVIAGLLPAPKELIDQLVEQVERLVQQYNEPFISNPANYTSKGKLKANIKNKMLCTYNHYAQDIDFKEKVNYISDTLGIAIIKNYMNLNVQYYKKIFKQLKTYYHPDNVNGDTDKFIYLTQITENL